MNIAVFIKKTTFHEGFGGLATQNKALCEGLVARGHNVCVFSPMWELSQDSAEDNGVIYSFVSCDYRMGKFFGFGGDKDKNNWINRSFEEFTKTHEMDKFDLVVGQSSAALGIIPHREDLRIPVVSIAHGSIVGEYRSFMAGLNWKNPKVWWPFIKNTGFALKNFFDRQRAFVHGSDRIVTVSNYVKQALIDETFAADDKFEVIHNGIDPEMILKATGKELNFGKHILYVGRVEKEKGLDSLVQMLSDKRFNDVFLDVIGGGPYLSELQSQIEKYDLQKNIKLYGKLDYSDVAQYFKSPNVVLFALPTRRVEGLPMVLVEAMFASLPVVAYDMGGVRDAVTDGETGFLVKAEDTQTFKDKMSLLLADEGLRERMRNRALEIAKKGFTTNVMIDKYLRVFEGALKKYENS